MPKEVKGFYIPSGFSIYLNTLSSNLNTSDSTFVHEYIHFLQDLLLPYCIRENLVFTRNFAWISKIAETNKEVKRPFNEWSDDCKLTFKQTEYTWGAGASNSGKIIDIKSDYFKSCYGHRIFRYTLTFDNGEKYQFGARDFLEYLAHKIQNQFWATNAPDLPYRTIDKIFEYYNLSFVPESVRLLIAEYCLYNDNPAHFFINAFIEQKIIENNPEQFFDYCVCSQFLLGIGWNAYGGFSESIQSKTERRLNAFHQTLTSLYPHRQFNSIKEWISDTNSFCKKELSNKFIISSLHSKSKEDLLKFIDQMIRTIGIPIVIFKDNTVTSSLLPPKYDSAQFIEIYILKQFIRWVRSNERSCPIKAICQRNYGTFQSVCDTNPFTFSGECKFSLFLKSYGLDRYHFEI